MFSKKKGKKEKEVHVHPPPPKSVKEKKDKKKESSKDKKSSKEKRKSDELSGGYAWTSIDPNVKDPVYASHVPSSQLSGSSKSGSKYSASGLLLVPPNTKKQNGILKSGQQNNKKTNSKIALNGNKGAIQQQQSTSLIGAQNGRLANGSNGGVTFMGPDNRVHQSLVSVSGTGTLQHMSDSIHQNQPLNAQQQGLVNPSLYTSHNTIQQNGYFNQQQQMPNNLPMMQQNSLSNINGNNPHLNELTSATEKVDHIQISNGPDTKHVTSINVQPKHQFNGNQSRTNNLQPGTNFSSNHYGGGGNQNLQLVNGLNLNSNGKILAEVNIPENFVDNRRKSDNEIVYAKLQFSQNGQNDENAIKKPKGILKQPKGKRVDFNKDVNVSTFVAPLTRHESLESLSIYDPIPPEYSYYNNNRNSSSSYFQNASRSARPQPLDDTDLLMYTMRRQRCPPVRYPTMARHSAVPPWLSSQSGRGMGGGGGGLGIYPSAAHQPTAMRGEPVMRKLRMLPPEFSRDPRYSEWHW